MPQTHADLDTLMAARHSCRGFKPDPVPDAIIEQIVTTAKQAPSWCNAQPWQLTITRGAETDAFRQELSNQVAKGDGQSDLPWPTDYHGAYQDRRRTCGWQLYDAVGVEKGDRAASAKQGMENFNLFGAPHVAILSSPAFLGAYGAMDSGGFLMAFTLAAQSLGVATIPQAALAQQSPFLHRYFDIPDDRLILCGISFGYKDDAHPANGFRTARANLGEIITWRG